MLFFTFAQRSRFPTMMDRYSERMGSGITNPSLRPESSRNYTLGYSQLFGVSTMGQIELFRSDMYDVIERTNVPEAFPDQCPGNNFPGFCTQTINVGKVLNQGIELTLRTNPVRNMTMNAHYTFLNRKAFDMRELENLLTRATPKHRVVSTAEYRLPYNVQVLASARYEAGARRFNTTSRMIVPGSNYAVFDLGGVIPIRTGLTVRGGVKNLLDRFYYFSEGFPEAGRNWYLNLRYDF
jgi:iron complex outermembrane receptor protein